MKRALGTATLKQGRTFRVGQQSFELGVPTPVYDGETWKRVEGSPWFTTVAAPAPKVEIADPPAALRASINDKRGAMVQPSSESTAPSPLDSTSTSYLVPPSRGEPGHRKVETTTTVKHEAKAKPGKEPAAKAKKGK